MWDLSGVQMNKIKIKNTGALSGVQNHTQPQICSLHSSTRSYQQPCPRLISAPFDLNHMIVSFYYFSNLFSTNPSVFLNILLETRTIYSTDAIIEYEKTISSSQLMLPHISPIIFNPIQPCKATHPLTFSFCNSHLMNMLLLSRPTINSI